jgi:hypothetical protein
VITLKKSDFGAARRAVDDTRLRIAVERATASEMVGLSFAAGPAIGTCPEHGDVVGHCRALLGWASQHVEQRARMILNRRSNNVLGPEAVAPASVHNIIEDV